MDILFVKMYDVHHKNPLTVDFHTHVNHELIFYREGEGSFFMGNQELPYKKDTIAIIPRGVRHNEINLKSSHNIIVAFRCSSEVASIISGVHDTDPTVTFLLEHMLRDWERHDEFSPSLLRCQLEHILLLLLERSGHRGSGRDFDYIKGYIDKNFDQPLTCAMLAKMCNYSTDRFRHAFFEHFGIFPKQYIQKRRLKEAEKHLCQSNMSVTEIAGRCGFYDSAQLSAMFRTEYGVSPTEYRAKNIT